MFYEIMFLSIKLTSLTARDHGKQYQHSFLILHCIQEPGFSVVGPIVEHQVVKSKKQI